ncbi:MAG: FecR domain-containing protein [Deltaproteobacteria bacterium]|nr:FecR domain-containing protein [Deltaproteobacteria bacterium]
MTQIGPIFRRYAQETAASPEACERVWRAARACPTEAEIAQSLLSRFPAVSRAEERAALSRAGRRHGPRLHRARAVVLATVTVAAIALVGLGLGLARPWDPPLRVELRSETAWAEARPARGVNVLVRGEGAIAGTEHHPRLRWDKGRMRIEVDPALDLDLVVVTREARAQVTGTVFSVVRDALGTHVSVSRGSVETTCLRGGEVFALTASEARTCLPTDAPGMLGRARALEDRQAPWQDVLDAAEAGLAQDRRPSTTRSELLVIRLEALLGLGRRAEALEAARAYLESGVDVRRADVERIAAGLGSP